jgi:hypothetical protein
MFLLAALSVLASSFVAGSLPSFGMGPVLGPTVEQYELRADDSPFFPPDPYEDDQRA